jgi:hypothetical protein
MADSGDGVNGGSGGQLDVVSTLRLDAGPWLRGLHAMCLGKAVESPRLRGDRVRGAMAKNSGAWCRPGAPRGGAVTSGRLGHGILGQGKKVERELWQRGWEMARSRAWPGVFIAPTLGFARAWCVLRMTAISGALAAGTRGVHP